MQFISKRHRSYCLNQHSRIFHNPEARVLMNKWALKTKFSLYLLETTVLNSWNVYRIPWLEYINKLLAPHVSVGLDEITIVSVPKYITDLEVSQTNLVFFIIGPMARYFGRDPAPFGGWHAFTSSSLRVELRHTRSFRLGQPNTWTTECMKFCARPILTKCLLTFTLYYGLTHFVSLVSRNRQYKLT